MRALCYFDLGLVITGMVHCILYGYFGFTEFRAIVGLICTLIATILTLILVIDAIKKVVYECKRG